MKILLHYFFSVIRKNRLSFILIIISLCLVSATVYINLCIDDDVFRSCEQQMDSVYHGFDASLEINNSDKSISADTGFSSADRSLAFSREYTTGRHTYYNRFYVCHIRTEFDKATKYKLLSLCKGNIPSAENEVVITQSKAKALSISIGDIIYINDSELTVTGFISDASIFETGYPNIVEIFGTLTPKSKCNFFLFDYSCEQETFLTSIKLNEEDYIFHEFEMDTFHKTRELRIIFGFILVMIGIIAAYVIYSSSTMIISNQKKAMATFVSVGACKKMITTILLGEGIIEGIFGGVLGVFTGEVFRYIIYHFYLTGSGYIPFSRPLFLLIAFGFTFLLQIGVSFMSIIQFHARTGKDNLFKIEKENTLLNKLTPYIGFALMITAVVLWIFNQSKNLTLLFFSMGGFFIGFVLLFPAVMRLLFGLLGIAFKKCRCGISYLACNSLCREKINIRNILLTTLVLSVSFISLFVTSSMNEFFTIYRDRFNYDVLIQGTNDYAITEDDCNELMEYTDDIDHIVKEYYQPIVSTLNGINISRKINYVMENEELGGMKYIDFDISSDSLEKGECLMDELMARHYGFSIGDKIRVHFQDDINDKYDFTVTIIGYCDSSVFNDDRDTIVLSETDFLTHITTSIRKVGLVLKKGVSVSDLLTGLKFYSYSAAPSDSLKIEDVTQYIQDEYDAVSKIMTLLGFIPIFVTILSVLGLVNNELLLFAERKKSYAVLASTCMNKKKLCILVLTEMFMMFIVGIIFALIFDSFFIYLIRDVIYVLFTYTEINLSAGSILGLIGIIFSLLSLGFCYFARQIMVMDITEEIRYE